MTMALMHLLEVCPWHWQLHADVINTQTLLLYDRAPAHLKKIEEHDPQNLRNT
jgi:hypothetical protein